MLKLKILHATAKTQRKKKKKKFKEKNQNKGQLFTMFIKNVFFLPL